MLSSQETMPARRRPQGRIILLTLIAAITIDKIFVSRAFPEVSGWVAVNPMPVFLDIPADLYLDFGLVPVALIFLVLYKASLIPYRSGRRTEGQQYAPPSLWGASTALLIVPCSILSGNLLYRLVEDQLSKQVRNAIGSFGITADIHSFLPGHELVHLRGNMVMFVFLWPGLYLCLRRIRGAAEAGRIPPIQASPEPTMVFPDPAMAIPDPIQTSFLPVQHPAENPVPQAAACAETAPITVSPIRIHVQYPRPFGSDC